MEPRCQHRSHGMQARIDNQESVRFELGASPPPAFFDPSHDDHAISCPAADQFKTSDGLFSLEPIERLGGGSLLIKSFWRPSHRFGCDPIFR